MAKLAAMTARAGQFTSGLRAVPSNESSDKGKPSAPASSGADITSAPVAASNERMNCLQAIRAGGGTGGSAGVTDMGRHRQTVDEIRRRLPSKRQLSLSNVNRRTLPTLAGAPPESPSGQASVSSVKSSCG
jgi:hypothetical protein